LAKYCRDGKETAPPSFGHISEVGEEKEPAKKRRKEIRQMLTSPRYST
jgi:hypothetical protein